MPVIDYPDMMERFQGGFVFSANNYSNCQIAFRNLHKIEEGTFVGSSPCSRAGYEQEDFDLRE